jgi:putative redox protein
MKVTLNRVNDDFHFQLINERGHVVDIDNKSEFGGDDLGVSPMELLLMGVAGCSSIDIITILKKQRQKITSFKAEVEGTRVQIEDAKPFKEIMVMFFLEGKIDADKAMRAAELSFDKYCSVSKTLEPTASINFKMILNNIPL